MKSITIIGNLGANAVQRVSSDGRQLMTFNVAVSQPNADALWFNCIGNFRERVFPFLEKGQTVCVMGDLSAGTYNGRIDLSINIDRLELVGSKTKTNDENDHSQQLNEETNPLD